MVGRRSAESLPHPVVDIDGHMIEYFPALVRLPPRRGHRPRQPVDAAARARRLRPDGRLARVCAPASAPGGGCRARRGGARRPGTRATSPPRCSRPSCTSGCPSSASTSRSCTRASGSSTCTWRTSGSAGRRAGPSTATTRRRSPGSATGSCPVAAIPMVTPEEAIDELEHAVGELGFKAVVMNGFVQRPADAFADAHPDLARWGMWVDTYGVDSAYDYDPVWAEMPRARRTRVVPLGLDGLGQPHVVLELHAQPHRPAQRGQPRGVQVAVPRWRHPPLPGRVVRVHGGRRGVGGDALRRPHRALGEAQRRRARARSIPSGIDVALLGELRAQYGGKLLELAAAAATGAREHGDACAGGPGDARRVGGVRDRAARRTSATCSYRASSSAARPTTR